MNQMAPAQLAQFMREGQPDDAVFQAAAKVPAEWMGWASWAMVRLSIRMNFCGSAVNNLSKRFSASPRI